MEIIETDALARFYRQRGFDTRFQTGTDEHGVKLQKTAAELNKTPAQICDKNSAKFHALRDTLNLSFDDFIRTSDQKRHWPAAQKMWHELAMAGKLEKRKYYGKYCAGCEEFKNEKDLIEGKCSIHKNTPEEIEEENWFFRLSDYSSEILEILESKRVEIVPEFRAKEILNIVREGLHDISFSRPRKSLQWGIPVPNDDSQTMYVWCDALTNYISAIGYTEENAEFQKWWPANVHVIGKDIVRFHAGIWLGMLLAAKLPLPQKIFVHGFITSEGHKMSKSLGNVINPTEIVEKWGTDALRYYLLSEIPIGQDGDFSRKRFCEVYNSTLANGLGNLVSRVVAMALKSQDKSFEIKELEKTGEIESEKMWTELESSMQDFDFRHALMSIFGLVEWSNKFITEVKPWTKENPEQQKILGTLLEIIRQIALALTPFLPETSAKILVSLGVENSDSFTKLHRWGSSASFKLSKTSILFPKK